MERTAASSRPAEAEPPARSEPPGAESGSRAGPFAAVQLEFGFLLGPEDGRYLIRPAPEAPAERVIVLATLGAPQRRLLGRRRRRGRAAAGQPAPSPVATTRATLVRAKPFPDESTATAWLEELRGDPKALATEVDDSVEILNRMLRAHRAAVADPYVREVRGDQAIARRAGYGEGVLVADGRLDAAIEAPDTGRRRRRAERLSPQERLAATLGGRRALLACEELALRARLDLDSRRGREAALQARIALEALLAELASHAAVERDRGALDEDRERLAAASNTALDGELAESDVTAVEAAVERMERALARHRAAEQ